MRRRTCLDRRAQNRLTKIAPSVLPARCEARIISSILHDSQLERLSYHRKPHPTPPHHIIPLAPLLLPPPSSLLPPPSPLLLPPPPHPSIFAQRPSILPSSIPPQASSTEFPKRAAIHTQISWLDSPFRLLTRGRHEAVVGSDIGRGPGGGFGERWGWIGVDGEVGIHPYCNYLEGDWGRVNLGR